MYILDTNTIIYFFKGIGSVAETLLSKSPAEIAIPSIVIYELEVGIAKSTMPEKRRRQLTALTSRTAVLPFGTKEAETAARIRARLEQLGTPIGAYDTLIAGVAQTANGTLVTHNRKEFERVEGLIIEDWF